MEVDDGTLPVGEQCAMSKLNPNQIKRIRDIIKTTLMTFPEIGRAFFVTEGTIRRIADGLSWQSVA